MRRLAAGLGLIAIVFVVLLMLEPLPVQAAATLVQQSGFGPCTNCPGAFVQSNFPNPVVSGDVMVVAVAGVNNVLASLSDSLGSSFTLVVSEVHPPPTYLNAYIYYAILSKSGTDLITATFSSPTVPYYETIINYELSGLTLLRIGTATGTGTGTTLSTSSPLTFQSGDFLSAIIEAKCPPICSYAPGAGFTLWEYIGGYATSGVSSPTSFPGTLSSAATAWVEAAVSIGPASPIPQYPLGVPLLALMMIIGYGLVRRRTGNRHP